MLLGTNISYCLSDILTKKVSADDVFGIISHGVDVNDMDKFTVWYDKQIDPYTIHFSGGKNSLHLFDFDEIYDLCLTLYTDGVILSQDSEPVTATFARHIKLGADHWYQINLRDETMEPAVKLAWDYYRMLAGLCK